MVFKIQKQATHIAGMAISTAARGRQDKNNTKIAPATHNSPAHATIPMLAPKRSVAIQPDKTSNSPPVARATNGDTIKGKATADRCRGRVTEKQANAA